MRRKLFVAALSALLLAPLAAGQTQPKGKAPAVPEATAGLVDSLVERLSAQLHGKTVAGEPIRIGSVTVIPILMIAVDFGGANIGAPPPSTGAAAAGPAPSSNVFLISGEARPVGFVAITKKGVQFLSVVPLGKSGE